MKIKNESTYQNSSTVRLVDGPHEWEGRVEVRPSEDDEWGTVCNEGWTATDASVVCKMLGLVIHPEDWRIYTVMPGPTQQPIWRSSVECIDLDIDIMQCKADDHMDHSCNHTQDVYVRCYKPTWSGQCPLHVPFHPLYTDALRYTYVYMYMTCAKMYLRISFFSIFRNSLHGVCSSESRDPQHHL